MAKSRDGWQWTRREGVKAGLPCIGVINPSQSVKNLDKVFDIVIIGAGYTGLTAARDLTVAGFQTLLLEGRDRVGGRTWSSEIDGYQFELGGAWVHWFQPHVYREISRYGMKAELVFSPDYTREKNYFTFVTEHGARKMSHQEEIELFSRALEKFANVDGNLGKSVVPLPFDQYSNETLNNYANMSVADRLEQIKNDLTDDERNAVSAVVLVAAVAPETIRRSWTFFSAFALRFFQEALSSGRLSYSFNTVITRVDSSSRDIVKVLSRDGLTFRAKRVICTAPLNVLDKVRFHPALSQAKLDAIRHKHVNQCTKLHAEIKDPEMRSWGGVTYPNNRLLLGAADGTTPSGNTHCVFFGCSESHLHAEEEIEETLKAVNAFAEMEVERLVSHNWSKDQFAEGAWVWYQPGAEVKYLETLRERHGPILFANSDWADGGWRSFIDGAIQSGTDAAFTVKNELQGAQRESHL
ncbi:hypothetical protein AYO22_11860 [Fonsecaea multimorphosa]|nr:hypothetical protein AYO22_11860 [Fonsecaea multimorphosa]